MTFWLKLILSPALIGLMSLAGRKWGPEISGWLVGLPLTTGPVLFFLAIQEGPTYATTAALGTLSGGFALISFALVYSWFARRWAWPLTTLFTSSLFLSLTWALRQLSLSLVSLLPLLLIALLAAFYVMPPLAPLAPPPRPLPRWDLPARMVLAVGIVAGLTGATTWLGARLTGLLATFPVYTIILAAFAHHHAGADGAGRVLYGLLWGLCAFVGFYATLILALPHSPLAFAFGAAIGVAMVVQGLSWLALHRFQPPPHD